MLPRSRFQRPLCTLPQYIKVVTVGAVGHARGFSFSPRDSQRTRWWTRKKPGMSHCPFVRVHFSMTVNCWNVRIGMWRPVLLRAIPPPLPFFRALKFPAKTGRRENGLSNCRFRRASGGKGVEVNFELSMKFNHIIKMQHPKDQSLPRNISIGDSSFLLKIDRIRLFGICIPLIFAISTGCFTIFDAFLRYSKFFFSRTGLCAESPAEKLRWFLLAKMSVDGCLSFIELAKANFPYPSLIAIKFATWNYKSNYAFSEKGRRMKT